MSDGTFFVNSDGLDTGKDGFHEKGNQIQDLALRINDLMNPARVAAAAGNDKNGQTFAQQHLAAAAKVHDGISTWGRVVGGTTDAIGGMANSFRRTDEVVADAGTQLGKSFLQLNNETDQALSGGSGGGGGPASGTALTPDMPAHLMKRVPAVPATDTGLTPDMPAHLMKRVPAVPATDTGLTPDMPAHLMKRVPAVPATDTGLTPDMPAHLMKRVPAVPASGGAKNFTVQPDSWVGDSAAVPASPMVDAAPSAATPGVPAGVLRPRTIEEPLTPESPRYIVPREPSVPPKADHP
jgi:hypothetical protein